MSIYQLLELCIYLSLLPIVYKVIIVIDISKIFKKNHTTEIKMFYFFMIIIITKVTGDFIIMLMDCFRSLLGITL
ncbi:DUF1146 family protein [Mycoplasmatota bacterium]|nr:DUF1146 family protein [Mycoplasmatota bacterium]